MKAKSKRALPGSRHRAKELDPDEYYDLRLYVAGQTPKSMAAFANLKQICDVHLPGKYRIEVIDLIKKPHRAKDDEVIAIPTLVRRRPEPVRKIIGDLGDTRRTLVGLEVELDGREQRK